MVPKSTSKVAPTIDDIYGEALDPFDSAGDGVDDLADPIPSAEAESASSSNAPPPAPAITTRTRNELMYDVDSAVVESMANGKLHEWTCVEFQVICCRHGLRVGGNKRELMDRVANHYKSLYK